MKPAKLLLLVGAAALVLAALPASAQPLSDYLQIIDGNGNPIASKITSSPEGTETVNQVQTLDSGSSNPGRVGDYIAIYEPDGTTLSDIVGIISIFGQAT